MAAFALTVCAQSAPARTGAVVPDESLAGGRRRELGRFLQNRRARLRPRDVGLEAGTGGRRRVAGLRREEVATLAGVGATWYTMLERGTATGVSASTLDAVARALRLTADETAYVHALADLGVDEASEDTPEPLLAKACVAVEWAPAYVCTARWNVIAYNRAMSLVWDIEAPGAPPFNIVRRMFADGRMRSLHGENFPAFASRLVAMVRVGAGRLVDDPIYRSLRDDLRDDPLFAAAWNAYDVASPFGSAATRIVSPHVGEFYYEAVSLSAFAPTGQSLVVQIPDEPSAARLRAALAR